MKSVAYEQVPLGEEKNHQKIPLGSIESGAVDREHIQLSPFDIENNRIERAEIAEEEDITGYQSPDEDLQNEASRSASRLFLQNSSSSQMLQHVKDRLYKTDVHIEFAEAAVVAPCDLNQGHLLRVDLGENKILVAQVPPGGVQEGETFHALYRIHTLRRSKSMHKKMATQWRPGNDWHVDFFGCFDHGVCHPSVIYSFCCFPWILLAQVANRMNLNWLGYWVSPNTPRRSLSRDTFTNVFLVFATYFTVVGVIITILANMGEEFHSFRTFYLMSATIIMSILLCIYSFVFMVRIRTSIRESYGIPGTILKDCVVIVCCQPCALSQMARQTADYDRQKARWFSETGVSDDFDQEFGLDIPESVIDPDLELI
mmetsp:Transcript_9914/g.15265  ORF Transcript_9914/g.15265 Transcript_9914/m.15265 type:complete len:371 (+) Transcript_9914:183-1295(+)|eukprot:CAMPEP_0195299494 /NCGR_PEP_ID=MMETSP0707-20130614/25654_1 /TAXON_ID=33640 /ORGANISM="Asterionellopsis glacialis, Strain CCMP134" /LENGTH=370 /DNA_ID=CAMNT_0040361917 /DNA_START=121 /DNA_END=1233 /DNA_ORIENTATION=+